MSRIKECEECGMEYYSEMLSPISFRHVFPEMVDRDSEIKRLGAVNFDLLAQIEKSKCCVNCKFYEHAINLKRHTCHNEGHKGQIMPSDYYRGCNFWRPRDAA